jgi:hypothetical protein
MDATGCMVQPATMLAPRLAASPAISEQYLEEELFPAAMDRLHACMSLMMS